MLTINTTYSVVEGFIMFTISYPQAYWLNSIMVKIYSVLKLNVNIVTNIWRHETYKLREGFSRNSRHAKCGTAIKENQHYKGLKVF